jgi:hypothetical protein
MVCDVRDYQTYLSVLNALEARLRIRGRGRTQGCEDGALPTCRWRKTVTPKDEPGSALPS